VGQTEELEHEGRDRPEKPRSFSAGQTELSVSEVEGPKAGRGKLERNLIGTRLGKGGMYALLLKVQDNWNYAGSPTESQTSGNAAEWSTFRITHPKKGIAP